MPRLGGPHTHGRLDAEVEGVTRVLQSFKVLTGGRLREFSHAGHWHGGEFEAAVREAVRVGKIRRLGPDLYEINEPGRRGVQSGAAP